MPGSAAAACPRRLLRHLRIGRQRERHAEDAREHPPRHASSHSQITCHISKLLISCGLAENAKGRVGTEDHKKE